MRATRLRPWVEAALPLGLRRWLRRLQHPLRRWPARGWERFETLRRLEPVSAVFGLDRGLPIDRYYIEGFLRRQASDIRGRVLEMGDDTYTRRFGGAKVTRADVLAVVEGSRGATIIADLTHADRIPADTFDCIVFVQTLQMIYDTRAALRHLHRILKPGGVLLATTHGISKIGRRVEIDHWGEYWRFTTQSALPLFQEAFQAGSVQVESHGNVLTAIAALHGLAAQELERHELDYRDPDYEVLIAIRAVKENR